MKLWLKNVVDLPDQEARNVGRSCRQHPLFEFHRERERERERERGLLSRRGSVPSTPRAHVTEMVMITVNMKERNMF